MPEVASPDMWKMRPVDTARLRRLRKSQRYSQQNIADMANITQNFFSAIETGKCDPALSTTVAIAKALGVTVNDLLIDVGAKNPTYSAPHEHLEEGERAIAALAKAREILNCPSKISRLMKDYGENGQVNGDEFRPIFEELREVVNGAFV